MRRVLPMDPAAEPTLSKMPGQRPLTALLRRVTAKPAGRSLSAGERSVLERLDTAPRGMSLNQFRIEWGGEWERKAQVLFDLIADGIVIYTTPAADPKNAIREAAQAVNRMQTTQKLIEQLETEYGPIDQRYTQEIEPITEEATMWRAATSPKLHARTPTPSRPARSVALTRTPIPPPAKTLPAI